MDETRRKFLKTATIGVAALGGAASIGCNEPPDMPVGPAPSGLPPDEANLMRLSMARTDLPVGVWEDSLALAKLAKDVFDDPMVAAKFRDDPDAYLRSLRLEHVKLDVNTIDVRLALALGDPELRSYVADGKYSQFIDALGQRGLLDPNAASPVASRIAQQLTSSLGIQPMMGVLAFAAAFVFVLVAVTYVTVGYTVVAGVMVATGAGVVTKVAVKAMGTIGSGTLLRHAPGLGLATAMGGADAGRLAAVAFVDSTVDSCALLLENSQVFREKSNLDGTALRALIRNTLCLQLALPPPT